MGVPQFPFATGSSPNDLCQNLFTYDPPGSVKKRLAGNVARLTSAVFLCSVFSVQCPSSSTEFGTALIVPWTFASALSPCTARSLDPF